MGARNLRFPAMLAATLAAVSCAIPQAAAFLNEVSPAPAAARIAAPGPASVAVNWNVQRVSPDVPNPGTISSPSLRVLIDGDLAATLPRSLSRSVKGEVPTETIGLREVIQIPQALVYRAAKQGGTLTLRRVFTDSADNSTEDADLLVTLSGPGSGALAVQRLDLAFDDGARSRVVAKGSELRAVAELKTSGVGLLKLRWEVATGAAVAGEPLFRPLALVSQGVGGGGRTVVTSPPLPTSDEGTHFLRLKILEPRFAYDLPTLQYYVTPARRPGAAVVQREILPTGPRPGAPLTPQTRFSWLALPDAAAYQLAFYEAPGGPAAPLDPTTDAQSPAAPMAAETLPAGATILAGIFLPAAQAEAVLGPATLAQLPAGRRYLWKVTAIGANGAIIGSSSVREIHKP